MKARGAVERERTGRGRGGLLHESSGARGVAALEMVDGERLGVGAARAFERGGEAARAVGAALGTEPARHGLADPVVVGFELALSRRPARVAAAHEASVAQDDVRGGPGVAELGGAHGGGAIDGAAGDREQLEQPARPLGERGDAGADQRLDADLRGGAGGGGAPHRDVAELADQEGAPPGLARDGGQEGVVPGARLVQEGAGQRTRLGLAEGAERDRSDLQGRPPARLEPAEQGAQAGARLRLLAAVGGDEEEARRPGPAEQVEEEQGAVLVPPLEIVDDHHDWPALGEVDEELAQSPRAAAAALLGVLRSEGEAGARPDRLDLLQHREEPRQGGEVRRDDGLHRAGVELLEVAAEGVDEAVEGLVRDRLLLVTARAEHQDPGGAAAQVPAELIEERALADARGAVHERDRGAALGLHRAVEPGEGGALGGAAHERDLPPDGRGHPAEASQQRGAAGASRGVPGEQARAELVEIGRHAEGERARRRRVAGDLPAEDLGERPGEGEHARERLVEEHPHAVPVTRGAGRRPFDELGGEVLRRPDQRHAAVRRRAAEAHGEAEVDEHQAPLGRHQDVGRLDVTVELACVVERGEPLDELHQHRAHPQLVEARRLPGDDRRGGGAPSFPSRAGQGRGVEGGSVGRLVGAADEGEQAAALDQLHGEEPAIVLAEQLVELDQVGVGEAREGAELLLEAVEIVGDDRAQQLEGDAGVAGGVEHLEDGAEAARAEPAPHLEAGVAVKLPGFAVDRGALAQRGMDAPESGGRLVREGRPIASLAHEAIVALHPIAEYRGIPELAPARTGGRTAEGAARGGSRRWVTRRR